MWAPIPNYVHACQRKPFFTGYEEKRKTYKHYHHLSALRTSLRPSESIRLSFEMEQASQYGETIFEVWFWQKVLYAYTACNLTFKSDKTIALSGVAAEFQSLSKHIYLAGLWKDYFLIDQLLWTVKRSKQVNGEPSARPFVYIPSPLLVLAVDRCRGIMVMACDVRAFAHRASRCKRRTC